MDFSANRNAERGSIGSITKRLLLWCPFRSLLVSPGWPLVAILVESFRIRWVSHPSHVGGSAKRFSVLLDTGMYRYIKMSKAMSEVISKGWDDDLMWMGDCVVDYVIRCNK